jgi:S1-C subfamily serine protease
VLNNFPSTQNFGILNVGNIRKLYAVLYPENIMVPCDLVGVNAKADIALIKITSNVPINNKYLTFIDNNMINIGDEVFVMGSPKTSVANIQSITRGIICNNRFPSDKIIERLMADVPAIFGNSGGPLINIKGQVVGVVQGGFSTSGKLDKINNFNSVSLIKPMIDYFINNGNTGQIYPSGFFGIYGIYVNDIVSVQLRGQLLSTDPSLVQGYYINNNVVSTPLKAGTGKFEDTIVPTVYSGSPADIIGLTAGDIILSAALNNEILMPITQTQMLLGTLVTLATNTGIIDIEYIKSAENWNILHTATVQLTGVPYDYEVLNNVFI